MKRARIIEPGRITLEDSDRPQPGPGEALIEVDYCGICGSDVHVFHDNHPFVALPVVPGHEFAGTVAELGRDVAGLETGETVTVEPQVVCGVCPRCRDGQYNICEQLKVIGCQTDGAMAEYVIVPADRVLKLPRKIDTRLGAMIEPLAVAVHALARGGGVEGKKILVIGAGTIGLSVLMAAKASGADSVSLSDPISSRLDLARRLGAEYVTQPGELDILAWSREVTDGHGYDFVVECVGSERALESAINSVRKGGTVVVVGVYGETPAVPVGLVQDRELSILGSLMYLRDDYNRALELIADGRTPVDELITHEFPLDEIVEAFRLLSDPDVNKVKVIINIKSD